MPQNKQTNKKKKYCVVCLIEPIVSLLIVFLPIVKVKKQGFISCRIELSSKCHRWLAEIVLFMKGLIFIWNSYHLPEFCSQNEKLRCLTEISDCLFLFIGVATLYPITKRCSNMIKAINLLTDMFESARRQAPNCKVNTKLGRTAYIVSHFIKVGLYSFCVMNLIFCYNTLKKLRQSYMFVTAEKYFSLISQICVYVLYIYVTLLTKRIFKIVNSIFYFEMKNISQRISSINDLAVCISEYKKQVFALNEMWMNFTESISSVAVISLVDYSVMCIIYSYCLIAWVHHDYIDVDWFYRTTTLIASIGLVLFSLDYDSWVSHFNRNYF